MRAIILTFVLLNCLGCVPYLSTYQYIQLEESAGLEVLNMGKHDNKSVYFHKKMPTSYRLVREDYRVFFMVDTRALAFRMIIRAEKNDGSLLHIKGVDVKGSCGVILKYFPSRVDPLRDKQAKIYSWGMRTEACMKINYDPSKSNAELNFIKFDVYNDSKDKIGSEALKFRAVKNGKFVSYDAI